jgi:hypothetical protein
MIWSADEPPMIWSADEPPMIWSDDEPPMIWSDDEPPMIWSADEPPMIWSDDEPPMIRSDERRDRLHWQVSLSEEFWFVLICCFKPLLKSFYFSFCKLLREQRFDLCFLLLYPLIYQKIVIVFAST